MGRFIDLAIHGGCSRKVGGLRLEELLNPLGAGRVWLDAACVEVGDRTLASTVDLVLPTIDDPVLFGRIVVAHVFSDLFAASAEPLFAMNILGLPGTSPADDGPVREMLTSAASEIASNGAVLLGGHSIENPELLFGIAAVGRISGQPLSPSGAEPGDVLVLTKPLGTGIATIVWKDDEAQISEFDDVVKGMIRTNRDAAELLRRVSARACTDVTGFGFMGHLHNMMRASGAAARIDVAALPRYGSTIPWAEGGVRGTRLLEANEDFTLGHVHGADSGLDKAARLYLFDAQVSGGLLAALPREVSERLASESEALGQPYWEVGVVEAGRAGDIFL